MYFCAYIYVCVHAYIVVIDVMSKLINSFGWLRLVSSLKTHVSFAENSLLHMSLLQRNL